MLYSSSTISHNNARSERIIDELTPDTQIKMRDFRAQVMAELKILLLFYSGARDYAEQWDLRKAYLFEDGVLAAAPGHSWHNFNRAIDLMAIGSDGKRHTMSEKEWDQVGKIGERVGLSWGKKIGDKPHFYNPQGNKKSSLRATYPGWQQYDTLEAEMLAAKKKAVSQKQWQAFTKKKRIAAGWSRDL